MSGILSIVLYFFFVFKQKTAYEMRISDWSSDVCSSDLRSLLGFQHASDFTRPTADDAAPDPGGTHCSVAALRRGRAVAAGPKCPPVDTGRQSDRDFGPIVSCRNATPAGGSDSEGRSAGPSGIDHRSEDGRVGKEGVCTCRSRWSPYH